jgi:hypothetical protein
MLAGGGVEFELLCIGDLRYGPACFVQFDEHLLDLAVQTARLFFECQCAGVQIHVDVCCSRSDIDLGGDADIVRIDLVE